MFAARKGPGGVPIVCLQCTEPCGSSTVQEDARRAVTWHEAESRKFANLWLQRLSMGSEQDV